MLISDAELFLRHLADPAHVGVLSNFDVRRHGSLHSKLFSGFHHVLRLACRECVYVVDELVGEDLHGFAARPSDMRRDDEIWQPQIEQNIALLGRLDRQDVETRAANDFVGQRLGQGGFVDEARRGRC